MLIGQPVAFAVAIAVLVWKARTRAVILALPTMGLHWGAQAGYLRLPNTTLEWGLLSVGLGFALLAGGLLVSWSLHRIVERGPPSLGRDPEPET